jgi:hypothetical protein
MRRYFVMLVLAISTTPIFASPVLTIGAGVESRLTRDVNPDAGVFMGFGELYLALAKHPWTALWELERAQNDDHVGNYGVQNTCYTTMLWGRYEPWSDWKVSPYAGLGLGWQINDVNSYFGSARDTRWVDGGGIVGLAVGAMTTLFKHWNIEGEMRAAKFEMENGPTWSVLLRSGYTF